jgi:UDP-glucose 4-epimerase
MSETDKELEILFKKMLEEQEKVTETDQIYNKDIEDSPLKVQWDTQGILAYQIFEKDNYSYKFGERLENPDITITFNDSEAAKKFLKGEIIDYAPIPKKVYNGIFQLNYNAGWIPLQTNEKRNRKPTERIVKPFLTATFDKEKGYHPFILVKMPMFREILARGEGESNYGVYVPINQSLGTYENQIIPLKIFKHFIDKASHIVMEDLCGCRLIKECKNHDVSLGCMHLGSDLKNIDLEDLERDVPQNIPGRVATKEEALERVQLAYENGLIPLLGRSRREAMVSGVSDTGRIMSMCFCCSCCCVNGNLLTYGSPSLSSLHRIEGLKVKVDEEMCVGCGECKEVCVFKGMEMIDDNAQVNQERCLGCGRCEEVCPNNAISIEFSNPRDIEELIDLLESYADVS